MAFKWKHTKSTLDEDLDLSSSDDEIGSIFSHLVQDEDKLLSDEIPPGATAQIPSTSHSITVKKSTSRHNSNEEIVATYTTKTLTSEEMPSTSAQALEKDKIAYDGVQGEPLSSPDKKTKRNQISCQEIDLDLDEICQQRNILPPPKAPRHHHFHYDRPITGARKKFYSIDPRQNLSLDEIIRMVPSGGQNQQAIRRRPQQHNTTEANWRSTSQQQLRNEKLKQGLQSIIKQHPNLKNETLWNTSANQDQEENVHSSHVPQWALDSWQCVLDLINKGYSIYWSVMKLKQEEDLTENQKYRLYRCIVSYNHVQGISEAASTLQAKHGAAADFLGKMKTEFPLLGKLTTTVDKSILLDPALVRTLIDQLREKYGHEFGFHFNGQKERVNNRILYKTTLSLQSSVYEGYSYINERTSKLAAAKLAFEKELGPCPVQKIYLGMDECTTDLSLYRGVESQMVHCLDFSRATIIDSETVHATISHGSRATALHGPQNHGRDVHVSFVDPTSKKVETNM